MSVVVARQLVKTYVSGDIKVEAVCGVDFVIKPSSFVSFIYPSGSGKSTLLNMVGCLDLPTAGQLQVAGQDITSLNRQAAARFRGEHIGFVFQDFNLIPVMTVAENVEYSLQMVQDWPKQERRERVQELLKATSIRARSRMGRNNGLLLPGRWAPTPNLCWQMSRQSTSTGKPRPW